MKGPLIVKILQYDLDSRPLNGAKFGTSILNKDLMMIQYHIHLQKLSLLHTLYFQRSIAK
jgi:hypothetical protein